MEIMGKLLEIKRKNSIVNLNLTSESPPAEWEASGRPLEGV
jgi:hypothetical protein